MSQNALLRSVKGLGIPGTARKEDRKTKLKVSASGRTIAYARCAVPMPKWKTRKDHFAVRNGVRCAGVHLIIDLHGAERLNDIEHIEATLAPLRGSLEGDASAHTPAPFSAERRLRRRGVGGKPPLDPHLAGDRLRRARRLHVRLGRS